MLPIFILIAVYAVGFVILIRKSHQIANYLGAFSENERFPVKINKISLLHIVLIALGIIVVIENIAEVLIYAYESFRSEVGRSSFLEGRMRSVGKDRFTVVAVQTIIAFIIIYFSKPISNWFFGNDPVEELTLESEENEN
jgi:hypothetical protein